MASKRHAIPSLPKVSISSPVTQTTQQIKPKTPPPSPPPAFTLRDIQNVVQDSLEKAIQKIRSETEELLEEKNHEMREDILLALKGLAAHVERLDDRVDEVVGNVERLEGRIERVENNVDAAQNDMVMSQYRDMEFALRIRGLKENVKENLKEEIAAELASILGCGIEEMLRDIEKIFRVNSWIAKQRNLPRDVVIYFSRRSLRNEIIQAFYNQRFQIAAQDVIILKEIPPKILRRRKDFAFLAEELKKWQIQFRWDVPVGIVVNYVGTHYRASISLLKEQFNMLLADQIAINLKYMKHNTFCNANKPGRWLAYQLRKKQKSRIIEKINYKGKEVYQQNLIKRSFLDFYSKLYASENIQVLDIEKYLQESYFPKLTSDQRDEINGLITSDEIIWAIKQLKVGKAPGTDGLTAIYYKMLSEEMIEPLKELFNNILLGAEVPPSWRRAFISLIPKEDQDLTQPKNYRPISLLNTDYKIFSKILANRLMRVLKQLVHSDQSGFISGRYMKYNVRQIVNLIEYLDRNNQIPAALIFLDAEKAFDQLDWQFLFRVVEEMNFGDKFLFALKAIYQQQSAQIIVNGGLTEAFKIEKGTRQGCPLSPLLFVLTMEILLIKIRESPRIKGIKINKNDYRLRAFADDLVVTLSQPTESVRDLVEILIQYGKVSGFKVNNNKTKILPKNMSMNEKDIIVKLTGFEIVRKVKYLGIYLTSSNVKLYKNNYETLWVKVQKDLNDWKKLQLSLLGRISAVKMNILPKFLFLFQMIPILKKDANLEEWQKGINKFIWAGKKPRVKFKIMQDTRERGGLKAPNLKLYYDAVALTLISDWLNLTNMNILSLEGWDLLYGWHAYLIYDKKVDQVFKTHILRSALLRVWKKYYYRLNYKIPIWGVPGHMIEGISRGVNLDKVSYKELLSLVGQYWQLKPLTELKQENIVYSWFYYNQLLLRWNIDKKVGITLEDVNLVKQIKDQSLFHIKRIYNALIELDSETELVKDCMIKWAQNIQEPILLDTWETIWVRNVKFTQAQNLRENFYKMFYRWHLDPQKLSRMYPNLQPKCWRCGNLDATYFHIWWTCKDIKAFWIKIWWNIQKIFKKKIKFTPQLFLLGIIVDLDVKETNLMLNLITAARLLVGQYWKKNLLPTLEEWILKVSNLAEMAKISAYLKDHLQERYIMVWRRWIDYIQKKYEIEKYYLAFE